MVQTYGNAITGGSYSNALPDIPRANGTTRTAHRPWCCDCKRTFDATQLDDDGRCEKCAAAAVRRAEAAARRAADPDSRRVWDEALRQHRGGSRPAPRQTPTPDSHQEAATGQPTTRRSAPRATSTSSNSRRARDAGASAHREKNPAAAQETRPAAAAGPPTLAEDLTELEATDTDVAAAAASYDEMVDRLTHPADHAQPPTAGAPDLRADLAHLVGHITDVRTRLDDIEQALWRLHALLPTTEQPSEQPAEPAAAQPQTPRKRRVMGDWTGQTKRTTPASRGKDVDEQAILAEYRAGDSAPTIARRHGIGPARVRALLDRHGVERRDDRAGHSGGNNRRTFTPDEIATMVRLYVDEEKSAADVGEALGTDRRVVSRALVEAGVTLRPAAHLTGGTELDDDQRAAIVQEYSEGRPLYQLAQKYRVRSQLVRELVRDAGLTIRPKGASTATAARLQDLGLTAKEVKTWAVEAGLLERVTTGLVAGRLIDAYIDAHPDTQEPS